MFTDDSPRSLMRRCALLLRSLADPMPHYGITLPGEKIWRLREDQAAAGGILLSAIQQGLVDLPEDDLVLTPWAWAALKRIDGVVVEIRYGGWSANPFEPLTLSDAIESLREDQDRHERERDIWNAVGPTDSASHYVPRQVMFEAFRWLPDVPQATIAFDEITMRSRSGEDICFRVDWRWEKPTESDVEELRAVLIAALNSLHGLLAAASRSGRAAPVPPVQEEEAITPKLTTDTSEGNCAVVTAARDHGPAQSPEVASSAEALLDQARKVILRESEDGRELQRVDREGNVLRSMPIEALGSGRSAWAKLLASARTVERKALETVEREHAASFDDAGIEAREEARKKVIADGRSAGYAPKIPANRKVTQRFRDCVWRRLADEIPLDPSELFGAGDREGFRTAVFRVSIWSSDVPNLPREEGAEQKRSSKPQSPRSDELRREMLDEGRQGRKRRNRSGVT